MAVPEVALGLNQVWLRCMAGLLSEKELRAAEGLINKVLSDEVLAGLYNKLELETVTQDELESKGER